MSNAGAPALRAVAPLPHEAAQVRGVLVRADEQVDAEAIASVEVSLVRTDFDDGDIERGARLAEGLPRAANEAGRAGRSLERSPRLAVSWCSKRDTRTQMAHALQTLLVAGRDARAICDALPGSRRAHGGAGRWLVPLTGPLEEAARELCDLDPQDTTPEEVATALHRLITSLARVTLAGPVVVAATEYFGGEGSQVAAAIERGTLSTEPFVGDDAINRALRLVGVEKGECRDELEAVGLHRWRCTEEIV